MVHRNEACEKCTQTCLLIHGQRDPSPIVNSFFKVMIDKRFSKVLYFPPRFARSVSHLTNKETYLEDSSGQKWKVGISVHNGSLAIREGWHAFSSEHGLKMGEFLVFHYIQGQHFVVQIFGTSGCQKIRFDNGTRTGKKRRRTNCKATSQDELLPETYINSRKKWNSTPSDTAVLESEMADHAPVTTTFASNIDAGTGILEIVPEAEAISDILQGENGPRNHVSTNSISQRESSLVYEVPVEMEFLTFKEPVHFLDIGITQTEKISEPANDILLLGQKYENVHNTGLISSTSSAEKDENVHNMGLISSTSSAENAGKGSHLVLPSNKESRCSNQVTREKSNEASHIDKRELKEMAAKTDCSAKKLNGKEPKIIEKVGQGFPMAVSGNNKVIKSEPADSGDASFPDAGSFSCLLRVDGRNFLELPQSWPQVLAGRKKLEHITIFLQGPDDRPWPVTYHERAGSKVLASRWTEFTAVYGIKPGDECRFQLLNLSERRFKVHIAHKLDVIVDYYEQL